MYFKSLDGLRGLAFLMVVIAHTGQKFKEFYIAGKVGVVVFFILSSFLITHSFLSESDKYLKGRAWVEYALKRLFRIYPMYISILIVELLIGGYSLQKFFNHIFLSETSKHYWTIPVEMTFYVFAPILSLIFIILLKKKFISMIAMTTILLAGYGVFYDRITIPFKTTGINEPSILFYLTPFLFGTILAIIQNNSRIVTWIEKLKTSRVTMFLIGAWACVLCSVPYSFSIIVRSGYGRDFYDIFFFYSVLFAVIILLTVNSRTFFNSLFENKLLCFIGSISYSGYLIHILIIGWVYAFNLPIYMSLICVILVTIGISALTNRFIEKPFIHVGRKFIDTFQKRLWS